MMHPHTKILNLNNNRGFGIFATQFIPKGTLVWVPSGVDQTFSVEQVSTMSKSDKAFLIKFSYLTNEGKYIVSHDNARYVNHACDANSLSVVDIEVSIAIRDIQPNEEITEDYGLYYFNEEFECLCGSPICRHKICQDDIQRHGDEWDHQIASVFPLIPKVEQPLWGVISSSLQAEIEAILTGKIRFPSCKVLKCSPDYLQKAAELLWS